MTKLEDRVVVLTGASSGIGRATALACAEQGATLVCVARNTRRRSGRCRRAYDDAIQAATAARYPLPAPLTIGKRYAVEFEDRTPSGRSHADVSGEAARRERQRS